MSQFYQQRLNRSQYYGPLVSQGVQSVESPYPEGRVRALLGQTSPSLEAMHMAQHGRLAGLGNDAQEIIGNEPPRSDANKWDELAVEELERDDDVFGSGIFDKPGRMTSNVADGVFASDYSLPGYVAREVPYAVSRDITDIASGGEVVMIPGGGLYHVEQDGSIQPSAILGPTPRPPMLTPATLPEPVPGGPTGEEEPYTTVQPEWAAQPPLNVGVPVTPAPAPGIPGGLRVIDGSRTVPAVWAGPRQSGGGNVPSWAGARSQNAGGTLDAGYTSSQAPSPTDLDAGYTSSQAPSPAPGARVARGLSRRSMALGQESTGPTAGEMAVAGILLGVSVGLIVSAVRQSKKGIR